MSFFKEKFDLLLASVLFLTVFFTWVSTDFRVEIRDILAILIGVVGTLFGIRRQQGHRQTDIQADNIESATTESGDVIVSEDSKISRQDKEIK